MPELRSPRAHCSLTRYRARDASRPRAASPACARFGMTPADASRRPPAAPSKRRRRIGGAARSDDGVSRRASAASIRFTRPAKGRIPPRRRCASRGHRTAHKRRARLGRPSGGSGNRGIGARTRPRRRAGRRRARWRRRAQWRIASPRRIEREKAALRWPLRNIPKIGTVAGTIFAAVLSETPA